MIFIKICCKFIRIHYYSINSYKCFAFLSLCLHSVSTNRLSCSLLVVPNLLIIPGRCEDDHSHCPPAGLSVESSDTAGGPLAPMSLNHHLSSFTHSFYPSFLTFDGNNDNSRTEMREDHMSRQIQGL